MQGADVGTTIFLGVCNGLGTAIGSYLATSYAIKHLIDPVLARIKKDEVGQ